MWSITKKSYAEVVGQNSLPQPKTQQTFTAEQLTKFVTSFVIQIAQPQVYANPKQDTLDLKSSICRRISNAAKTILRKDLFESIGSLSVPAPPLNHSHSRPLK